jgi:hypothetical protein
MPLQPPIITIALSRADLAERRAELVPYLLAGVIDRLRGLGDPEEVCAAYEPSLTAAIGAWWDEHFTCTEVMDEIAAGEAR